MSKMWSINARQDRTEPLTTHYKYNSQPDVSKITYSYHTGIVSPVPSQH